MAARAPISRWQTDEVPVVEGQVFLQAGLVFGLIGLLGLVLRWTFGRDAGTSTETRARGRWRRRRSTEFTTDERPPTEGAKPHDGRKTKGKKARGKQPVGDKAAVDATAWGRTASDARPTSPAPARPTVAPLPHHEDYGLLAVAAEVGTADEAATVRRLLKEAGIRNTNAVAADGRHKVLVFGHELMRARRVAGGGTTGTGGAQGAGGS
jgi:hypothetical protein